MHGGAGGSDTIISALSTVDGGWLASGLTLPIEQPAPRLIITADVDSLATAGARVQLSIPENGCTYASGNDGPRDTALVSPTVSVVSTAALRIAERTGLRFTWFIDAASWKHSRKWFARLQDSGQDVQLHCYRHMTYVSREVNEINIAKGLKVLKRMALEFQGDKNSEFYSAMTEGVIQQNMGDEQKAKACM